MYKESVRWYFANLMKEYKDPASLTLESYSKHPKGRCYYVVAKYTVISPSFNARDMKIWLDAYKDGVIASKYIDRSTF